MNLVKKAFQKAKEAIGKLKSRFDSQGSYTGSPEEGNEPEQDADDL